MSEYGEYKMKSTIVASADNKAKALLHTILRKNILELNLTDETSFKCTTNESIAGTQDEFNTEEIIYVYNIDENEWQSIKYYEIETIEYISSAR